MALQWVHEDSQFGAHAKGLLDLLRKKRSTSEAYAGAVLLHRGRDGARGGGANELRHAPSACFVTRGARRLLFSMIYFMIQCRLLKYVEVYDRLKSKVWSNSAGHLFRRPLRPTTPQ